MDHAILQKKIKEFENRIRKWHHLRFGLAEPSLVVPRRSASQDPRRDPNVSTSTTSSPAHRLQVNISKTPAGSATSPMSRKRLDLSLNGLVDPRQQQIDEINQKYQRVMENSGRMTIMGKISTAKWDDLQFMSNIGNGSCGQVSKYKYHDVVMAVKEMARTQNPDENKRIIMDLAVVSKTADCPNIVLCYGYFISQHQVRVCMELMATCLDRLLKRISPNPFPERVIGKMAVSIVSALDYLKNVHNIIHRDVKPSNILMSYDGTIKLCDFGISGQLVESMAHSIQAGCPPYMAPERFDAPNNTNYDIRSDVWSLGITLVELATGKYPYQGSEFEVLSAIISLEPPKLLQEDGFTPEFCEFTAWCLTKDVISRPKYDKLLGHEFIKRTRVEETDVGEWFAGVYDLDEEMDKQITNTMKVQVLLLLGLMCYSALSFTKVHEVEGANNYQLGEDTGKCCVRLGDAGTEYCYADSNDDGACQGKGIFLINNKLWVVLQVDANADLLVAGNTEANDGTAFDDSALDPTNLRDGTVLIGEIDTTSFKFTWATYVAARDATTVFGAFTVSAADSCDPNIQVTGDIDNALTLMDKDGAQITGVTGDGIHLVLNTGDKTISAFAANAPVCTAGDDEDENEDENENENEDEDEDEDEDENENEDGEEEEEEGNSASILSVASALLAFFGLFAL